MIRTTCTTIKEGNETAFFSSSPGLLEEERLASAHQAEAFTRQIQNLQGTKSAEQWSLFWHMVRTLV